jgi:hypothetical protein
VLNLNEVNNATIKSSVPISSGAWASAVSGRYAYVGGGFGTSSLTIIDIADPSFPKSVTTVTMGARVTGVAVAGKYVYVAATSSFQIWDVSDHTTPRRTFTETISGGIADVFVSGRYAYVVGGTGLRVFDISTAGSATTVSSAITPGEAFSKVYVNRNYAYITDTLSGTKIVDVSDPRNPLTVGTISVGNGSSNGVYVSGRYAYLAHGSDGLRIYDVSDPDTPVLKSQLGMSGDTQNVYVSGRYAYVAGTASLAIIDVSSSTRPVQVATTTIANAYGVTVAGKYAYVSVSSVGFSIVDIQGADISSAHIGNIWTNDITVLESISIGNTADIRGGLTVGDQGIMTNGPIGASALSAIQLDSSTSAAGYFMRGFNQYASSSGAVAVAGYVTTGTVGLTIPPLFEVTLYDEKAMDSAAGYFVNGIITRSATSSAALVAYDMSSSTYGGAILGKRNCGTSSVARIMNLGTDTDGKRFSVDCTGKIWSDNGSVGTPGDYAEYFPTDDVTITDGEVVALKGENTSSVKRAMATDREHVVGVISLHPLILGNAGPDGAYEGKPNYKIVGLLGQLPIRVSTVNGPITAGDKLMAGDDGYAVKASGVGMIIGRALETLTTSTGMIMAYVNPSWSGDGILEAATSTTNIKAQGIATTSTAAMDSYGLTFQGSAWNTSVGTAITSNFTLINDVINASSSLFTIKNAANASLLTISDAGDVTVSGDLTVGRRLFLGSKTAGAGSTSTYVFVDDTQAPSSTYIATNADGWSTSSTYDYAERFASAEHLEAGDVVTADIIGVNQVKRSTNPNEVILGIVSTKPGFITGGYASGTYPIALAGRVPTRVSTAGGAIVAGDQLAASDVPGVAIKAIGSGPVVGVALESYDAPTEGKISVFVQPGWKGGEIMQTEGAGASTIVYQSPVFDPGISPRAGLARIAAGSTEVNVAFPSLNSYPLVTVTPYGVPTSKWGLMNVTDHGFTITLSSPENFDLILSWKAEPSGEGGVMSFSDGTSATYDPLTGQPVMGTATTSSAPSTIISATSTEETTSTSP